MSITCPNCRSKWTLLPLTAKEISKTLPVNKDVLDYMEYLFALTPLIITSRDLTEGFRERYPESSVSNGKLIRELTRLGLPESYVARVPDKNDFSRSQRVYKII